MRHAPMLRNAMPAAQPSLSMKSGVIGNSPTRPRIPSVPKYFFVISAPSFLFGRFYCGNHADDIHGLGDIMHTQDARTLGHSKCRKRQPTIKPIAHRTIQRLTYHALARNADQQRPTQGMQGFHMFEQTQIVLQGLGEAKPRIEEDLVSSDPCCGALSNAISQEPTYFANQILVVRIILHIAGLT